MSLGLDKILMIKNKIMYYIYHIEGVKIGCSKEPDKRVKTQGYNAYSILESHSDIKKASERELELQKQYGYEVDNRNPYYVSYNKIKAAHKQREVIAIRLSDNFETTYKSVKEAADDLDIHTSNIFDIFKGRQKTAKGYTFKSGELKLLND